MHRAPTPDPLPDDAVVVRGGQGKAEDMKKNAEAHEKANPGEYALSGFCVPGLGADDTARFAREQGDFYMPQPTMRAITVGALAREGFSVRKDEPPPGHVAIMLSSPLVDAEIEQLSGMFGPIVDNPVAK
jgi:hypothetical protein